jgi:hypothetical protein
MRISNSEIQTWKRCRRKWWFQYYRGLAPILEKPTGPMTIGSRVHAVLEVYYDTLLVHADTDTAIQVAMDAHNGIVDSVWDSGVVDDEKKFLSEVELTRIMIEGYFEWLQTSGEDEGLRVIATEQNVEYDLDGIIVMGKLDQQVEREQDGAHLFIDYKTCDTLGLPMKTIHINEQVLMYEWLLTMTQPGVRIDGGIFSFLRKVRRTAKATPPFFARADVRHSAAELHAFNLRLLGELRAIIGMRRALDDSGGNAVAALSLVYPTPTQNCSWDCPFFMICPMTDRQDGSLDRMIELTMKPTDPYARYELEGTV